MAKEFSPSTPFDAPLSRRVPARSPARPRRGRGLVLGHPFGIEVALDWSLLIIFVLIAVNLSAGLFPEWHPDWSVALSWSTGLAAAVLFLGSVLLHELSHAIVGRAQGIPIRRITLFVFGGLTELEREAETPRAELFMAIVGPLTSLFIGFGAMFLGAALAPNAAVTPRLDPEVFARGLGPVSTLLFWLGPLNVVLGLFNLIPGFPLDGGRVLRAALWWGTGSLERATRWASACGRGFGWALMGLGIFLVLGGAAPFFGRGLVQGLWLVLIGWFLHAAARQSYAQHRISHALEHVPVTAVMRTRFDTVEPSRDVATFVEELVMNTDQRSFPVLTDGVLLGIVGLEDVRRLAPSEWAATRVDALMTPAEALARLEVDEDARTALDRLVAEDVDQLPVLDHGKLRGLVRRQDLLKWVALHGVEEAMEART